MIPRTPVHITVTIEGPADDVLGTLQRISVWPECDVRASVNVATIHPEARRQFERTVLPRIEDGDATAAIRKIEALSRQQLIEPETERAACAAIFEALRDLTKKPHS